MVRVIGEFAQPEASVSVEHGFANVVGGNLPASDGRPVAGASEPKALCLAIDRDGDQR